MTDPHCTCGLLPIGYVLCPLHPQRYQGPASPPPHDPLTRLYAMHQRLYADHVLGAILFGEPTADHPPATTHGQQTMPANIYRDYLQEDTYGYTLDSLLSNRKFAGPDHLRAQHVRSGLLHEPDVDGTRTTRCAGCVLETHATYRLTATPGCACCAVDVFNYQFLRRWEGVSPTRQRNSQRVRNLLYDRRVGRRPIGWVVRNVLHDNGIRRGQQTTASKHHPATTLRRNTLQPRSLLAQLTLNAQPSPSVPGRRGYGGFKLGRGKPRTDTSGAPLPPRLIQHTPGQQTSRIFPSQRVFLANRKALFARTFREFAGRQQTRWGATDLVVASKLLYDRTIRVASKQLWEGRKPFNCTLHFGRVLTTKIQHKSSACDNDGES